MKCAVLYSLIVIICSVTAYDNYKEGLSSVEARGIIENTINTTLNKIKEKIPDPFIISAAPFDFGSKEPLSGGLNVTKVIINGVKDFVANEIKVTLLKQEVTMKITIPEVSAQLKYWADMVLLNLVPLYGQGRMSINFDEIEIDVKAGANWIKTPIIQDIWLSITLSDAIFHLDGLLNDAEYSALISNVLNDNFTEFINGNTDFISSTISPIAQDIINYYLQQKENVTVRGIDIVVKT